MKLTTALSLCLLILLPISCTEEDEPNNSTTWRMLDFDKLTLRVPDNWLKMNAGGYDSFVDVISSQQNRLLLDLGSYGGGFGSIDMNSHISVDMVIDERTTQLIQPNDPSSIVIGIFIDQVYPVSNITTFKMKGSNIIEEDIVIEIFKSIQFK